jgi:hypothetical protein
MFYKIDHRVNIYKILTSIFKDYSYKMLVLSTQHKIILTVIYVECLSQAYNAECPKSHYNLKGNSPKKLYEYHSW